MEKTKTFERRRETLKRKARELSSLCDVDVCFICVGPSGDLSSWPENPDSARSVVEKYYQACDNNRNKKRKQNPSLSVSDSVFAESCSLPLWDEQICEMSKESQLRLYRSLESKIENLNARVASLTAKQEIAVTELDWSSELGSEDQWIRDLWKSQPNMPIFDDTLPAYYC